MSKSTRRLSEILQLKQSAVYRILKDLHLKPYIPRLHKKLSECDFDRRVEFCEQFYGLVEIDSDFPYTILYSDEAKFHLSGAVNRHNTVFWSDEKPENINIDKTAISPGVTVWCWMGSEDIIGPVYFDTTVKSENFLARVINDVVIPYFDTKPRDHLFQQDRATAHYAVIVQNRLNEILEWPLDRQAGAIEWPARSPDFTPCDFFLWGYLKNKRRVPLCDGVPLASWLYLKASE